MTRIKALHPISIASIAIALVSCGGNKEGKPKDDSSSKTAHVTEVEKFISNPDSKDFLPDWKKENTVVVHFIGEPDDMHPTNGTSEVRTFINHYTQCYVMDTDPKALDVRPGIVKAGPVISEDGLSYTYELMDEPTWDDGSQLTVEDIIFTFKANKCPLVNNPHAKPYLDPLKDIVVDPTNPRKFTLVMKRKYIQNIIFLTDYGILQRKYFDPKNTLAKYSFAQLDDPKADFNKAKDLNAWATEFNNPKYSREVNYLVGLGAYKWTEWKPQQSMTLVRKTNHWTSKLKNPNDYETAYPEKIIFKVNTDANSQMLEFKTQAMDVGTYLATPTLVNLQKDPKFNANYHSRFTDTYNYSYIAMNTRPDGVKHKKIFTDKTVRRAMAMLTPVDDINTVINMGKNTRIAGPVSPLKEEYNKDLKLIAFDIEGAKKLLDQAGWKDTDGDNIRDKVIDGEKVKFEFDLAFLTTQVQWKDIASMISEAMYKAGVKANLKPNDFAVHYDNAKNHNFDMLLAAWGGSSVPEDFEQIWSTKSWTTKGSNYPGFGNAESDLLVDEIKYTLEEEKRIELVKKLQAIIYDEQPYIFLYSQTRRNVIHKRFGNALMTFERPGVLLNNHRLLNSASAQ
jgi:peptide/nickel transport system substrate-binding protein